MCSYCGQRCGGRYDKQVCRVRDLSLAGRRIYLEYERWRVKCSGCGGVHVEHLDWLANNSRYTQRFATHVGKLCRDMPDKAVAEMERLRLLVEGVNNKIRVLQRRAYGYRDEEYLKLKIVAAFLPPLPRNAVFNPHESA